MSDLKSGCSDTTPCLYTKICLCAMSCYKTCFQLDCHHHMDYYPNLGKWWLLSKVHNDLAVVRSVDLISYIWLIHCVRQCWCNHSRCNLFQTFFFLATSIYDAITISVPKTSIPLKYHIWKLGSTADTRQPHHYIYLTWFTGINNVTRNTGIQSSHFIGICPL